MTGVFPASALRATSREEWLAARKTGIGGSDAAAVMGVSPWKSPFSLWAEKTGLEPDLADNEVLRWGRILEQPIADDYATLTGRRLQHPGDFAIQRNPDRPWQICTLDRLIDPIDDRGSGSLSIKYVGPMKAGNWKEDAPLDYQVQLQHELAVTGLRWGSFAVLVWGKGVQWLDVERNESFIDQLTADEHDFWRRVETGDAPDPDGSDATTDALKLLYPRDNGLALDLKPGSLAGEIAELRELKAAQKTTKARIAELENAVKALLAEASELRIGGKAVATYRTIARKGYEVKATEYRALKWKGESE